MEGLYRPRLSCKLRIGPNFHLVAEGVAEGVGITLDLMDLVGTSHVNDRHQVRQYSA